MKKRSLNHLLISGLGLACAVCMVVFGVLTVYLNRKNDQTISELGSIFMSSMNNRITMHFSTMTEHRMDQMRSLAGSVPEDYAGDPESLRQWLLYSAQSRGFDSVAFMREDGSLDMLYGSQLTPGDRASFMEYMKRGESRLAVGFNSGGDMVIIVGVPIGGAIPGHEDCIALVGEMPLSYLVDTLSLEEEDSLIYSFVIRMDGSFVVRTSDAVRDNYFDRVRETYEALDGRGPEDYIQSLTAAMEEDADYATIIQINGERCV